ncbi:hypothetical protein KEM55_002557 [Ascosphaera atra]|nr:hypothetical protein KEM55_002557 [Ascosphaera atra]
MAGRGSRGPSGVLPVPASATQKGAEKKPSENNSARPAPRLKLVVRRLPPGLTQTEFEAALGEEWKVGNGRVDWYEFRPGKVTKGLVNTV